jgi:hypothetical protein
MADDDKSPIDQLLDLCVFGPLGLLVTARMKYPQLVEQGRQQLEGHARLGRFVAHFATTRGKHEAEKAVTRLRQTGAPATPAASTPPATTAAGAGGGTTAATKAATVVAQPAADPPPAAPALHSIADEEVIAVRHDDDDPTTAGSVGADELAIPAYDSLAASQVVQRLDGLTDLELEAVRRYEVAHRARKTVLGKVAQLQRR